jgi:hypothetical protein
VPHTSSDTAGGERWCSSLRENHEKNEYARELSLQMPISALHGHLGNFTHLPVVTASNVNEIQNPSEDVTTFGHGQRWRGKTWMRDLWGSGS